MNANRTPSRAHPFWFYLRPFAFICGYLLLLVAGGAEERGTPLLIAFSSFRDRPLHPRLYFYEHDGLSNGTMAGALPPVDLRVETHASLTTGGKLVACASELENQNSESRLFDAATKQELGPFPGLNTEAPEVGAAISSGGGWLAFSAWNRAGAPAGWNVFLYDLGEKKLAPLPVNTDDEEREPALSGDGRLLAFVSNRPGGAGLSDVYLFDRQAAALVPLPGLNSPRRESEPSLSADGRWLAFTSDRPGGRGGRDLYLYDRQAAALVPLPGLNEAGNEGSPSLTPSGRYLAFVAERVSGMGERDLYLYDRQLGRLIPTPGLNSKGEDFDPAVTERQ